MEEGEFETEARAILASTPQLVPEFEDAIWWMGHYLESLEAPDDDRWAPLARLEIDRARELFVELLHYAADTDQALEIEDEAERAEFIRELIQRRIDRLQMRVKR